MKIITKKQEEKVYRHISKLNCRIAELESELFIKELDEYATLMEIENILQDTLNAFENLETLTRYETILNLKAQGY